MKKLLLLFFLPVVLLIFTSATVFAQEEMSLSEAGAANDSTMSAKKIEYELPYPGVLPGNPLYYIKAFRDRLLSFLISDSLKKAEYNLLNADKRLLMGVMLVDRHQDALAVTTISKGNNYFAQAISSVTDA